MSATFSWFQSRHLLDFLFLQSRAFHNLSSSHLPLFSHIAINSFLLNTKISDCKKDILYAALPAEQSAIQKPQNNLDNIFSLALLIGIICADA
jgi:hypothetical protein